MRNVPIQDVPKEFKGIVFILKYYYLYNISETLLYEQIKEEQPKLILKKPLDIMQKEYALTLKIEEKGSAFWNETKQSIGIPPISRFVDEYHYWQVMFHEIVHSTAKPLKRKMNSSKSSYAFEELVAEIGAAMLMWECGFDPQMIDNSKVYVAGWHSALESNKNWIVSAAGQAQKAVNLILGEKNE